MNIKNEKRVSEWTFFDEWREYMALMFPVALPAYAALTVVCAMSAGWALGFRIAATWFVLFLLGSLWIVAIRRRPEKRKP